MTHPEIPPNCPFMAGGKVDNAEWFRVYGSIIRADVHLGEGHAMSLDPEDADAKRIIACVAAEYWRKEMGDENTMDDHVKAFADVTPFNWNEYNRKAKCMEHVRAWRKWGGLTQ